jgi:[ribosomal protein S18]-alanine N-acetyltransferase
VKPTPEPIRVRQMAAADITRVIEIAQALPEAPQWPEEVYRKVAASPEALPRRYVLLADDVATGTVSGFAVVQVIPPESELESIAVDLSMQGRGIGKSLLAAVLNQLREDRVTELRLEVRATNAKAIGLYRAFGAVETGLRQRYYSDPEEDAVLMKMSTA